jgi:hypothetical protein
MLGNIAAAAIVLAVASLALAVSWNVRRHLGPAVVALAVIVIAVLEWVPALRDTITSHTTGTLVGMALGMGVTFAYSRQDGRRPSPDGGN